MIASSPVRMQDQNPAMLQASAVQIHHQYVQHVALSSEPPAAGVPVAGAAASWSQLGGTSSLVVDDTDLDVASSFQQLLDSFGSQSDVDDDTVVNLDESMTVRARHVTPSSRSLRHLHHHQQRLQSILPPQHHAVCSAARC